MYMPRTARIEVVNEPHHVYQRTIGDKAVFLKDKDYQTYLDILKGKAEQYKVDILAYCLMNNHVHFVAIPRRKGALSKAIGRTHFAYTQYLNSKRTSRLSIWRNRFQSCVLGGDFLWKAVQLVETKPVLNKKARKADKYPWSSAAAHTTGKDPSGILALNVWPSKPEMKKLKDLLTKKLSPDDIKTLHTFTQTGRPLGPETFVKSLEKKFKRRLHPLPVGRPPKKD